MTRSNAREVAVHMIYELGFGSRSAEELLEHEMTRERFAQLGEEEPSTPSFPTRSSGSTSGIWYRGSMSTGRSWMTTSPAIPWAGALPASPAWRLR